VTFSSWITTPEAVGPGLGRCQHASLSVRRLALVLKDVMLLAGGLLKSMADMRPRLP